MPMIRRSIYVGRNLDAFLEHNGMAARSVSDQLDRLAQRYAALIAGLAPQRWSVRDWWAVVQVIQEIDVREPGDALVVALRLRQKAAQGQDSQATGVAYRMEALRPPEQLAVVELAERAKRAKVDQDGLGAWLAEQGVGLGERG